MHQPVYRLVAACALALLTACVSVPPAPAVPPTIAVGVAQPTSAQPASPAASAPRSPASAARAATPGSPPAFTEVIKDAKEQKGYFNVWTKDEKTWLELRTEQLGQPFFFGNSLASGLGERMFLPGLMGKEQVVTFKRVGNAVQLIALNVGVRAPAGTPLERAVRESYSDSLLAAVPMASAEHPERKSLLIDASALLLGDLMEVQTALESAYRMPYALDRGNSAIERVRTSDKGTFVTVRSHFAVPKLPAPPVMAAGGPPPNPAAMPNPPRSVPDARSLFLSLSYTLAPLPDQPMKPRQADQRVGYFTDAFLDFGNSRSNGDRQTHVITRWRLDKKDPTAAVSEPKDPVRVVMDKNIPEKWRAAVQAGILEWNKAFERAGLRNALVVEQQAADADWSSVEGTRVLAVRWFALNGPGAVAVGPSQTDARTGEILRGAAIIPENWVLLGRTRVAEQLPRWPSGHAAHGHTQAEDSFCSYASDALEQAEFAYALLTSRGELDPNSPEAENFIAAALKDVVMHEVGHALGLRHNFKASTGIKLAQLRELTAVRSRGVSNSVMDYNALNVPLDGELASEYHQTTLGAYDYWAIEYGYRHFDEASEREQLQQLAARSATDTSLAYATDEDAGSMGVGIDPLANQFDLGDDPLAWADRQFKLVRELWQRTQSRPLAPDDTLAVYRRNLQRGLSLIGQSSALASKYVGGVYTSRATAGAKQPLYVPVPADKQKLAMQLLAKQLFATDSFRFDPKFMSRLGYDQLDRLHARQIVSNTDFSLASAVLSMQREALNALMSEALASRMADAETKVANWQGLYSFAHVQTDLAAAVWSELAAGGAIDSLRRNLQREHLKRLAGGLLRPGSAAAADVRSVYRVVALKLQKDMRRALAKGQLDALTRAHLSESEQTLSEALKAPLSRQGA